MATSHEEADVIIVQQMVHIAYFQEGNNINIIYDDTDVFSLLIYYYIENGITCNVVMEGTSSTRTIIDIGATAAKHEMIIPSILGMHSLTGYDTVSYLYGIGKATSLRALTKGFALEDLGNQH